jgi:hypothetical protein
MIVLGGGQAIRLLRRVHPGLALTSRQTLLAVDIKESRIGRIALVTSKTVFVDRAAAKVAEKTETALVAIGPIQPEPSDESTGSTTARDHRGRTPAPERHRGNVPERRPRSWGAGDLLPPVSKTATTLLLFRFSAVVGAEHRIHYDHLWALHEGHPGVLVHQTLHAAFIAEAVQSAMGPLAFIAELSWKNRKRAYAGDNLVICGKVTSVDGNNITCDIDEENDRGELCVEAKAVVVLDR